MNGLKKMIKNKKLLWSVGAVAAVIAVCVLLAALPFRVIYPDVSGSGTYRVSDVSKRYLGTISEDVEIIYYSEGGKHSADKDLYSFVRAIAAESDHIRVRLEDPERTGADAADQSVEIRSAKRSKTVLASELFYYYNNYYGAMSVEEYARVLTQLSSITDAETYSSYLSVYGPSQMTAYNSADITLISAIRYVLADRAPKLYAYGNGGSSINALFRAELEQAGYSVTVLDSMETVPADCEGLYLSVLTDLTATQATALSSYLAGGGSVFLTTDYATVNIPNLSAVMAEYGLSSPDTQNYLCVLNTSSSSSSSLSPQFYAVTGDHPITDPIGDSFVAYSAHLIETEPAEGVTHSVLLRASDGAYHVRADLALGEMPETGSFPLCVLAEKDDSSVLWLSMPLDSMMNSLSSGADFAFVKQSFDYFTQYANSALNIADTQIPSSYLTIQSSARTFWMLAFIIVIPATVFTIGAVRCYVRKKRG